MRESIRDSLITALHDTKGYLSGEVISNRLGVSRTAVWKQVQRLKKEGYHILTVRRKGYRLLSSPRDLFEGEISRLLETSLLGRDIRLYKELASTNAKAIELARDSEIREGTFVIANLQRGGKGRLGRHWLSLPGGLWASGILRPGILPQQAPLVTFAAAVAITRAIREMTNLEVSIKWPNDIFYNGRKLGGILSEIESEAANIHFLVLGFGLNVNIRMSKFPQPLRAQATSVYRELKKEISLNVLFVKILKQLESLYELIQDKQFESILDSWKEYNCTLGEQVSVALPDGSEATGVALDVNQSGALMLKTVNGQIKTITSGDLSIVQVAA